MLLKLYKVPTTQLSIVDIVSIGELKFLGCYEISNMLLLHRMFISDLHRKQNRDTALNIFNLALFAVAKEVDDYAARPERKKIYLNKK